MVWTWDSFRGDRESPATSERAALRCGCGDRLSSCREWVWSRPKIRLELGAKRVVGEETTRRLFTIALSERGYTGGGKG